MEWGLLKRRSTGVEIAVQRVSRLSNWLAKGRSDSRVKRKGAVEFKRITSASETELQRQLQIEPELLRFVQSGGDQLEKSQSDNPKKKPDQVAAKREKIKQKFNLWREAVLRDDLVLLFVDECHLLWGDVCGYSWGRTDQRLEIPIVNEKERQTYFGALNCLTGEMLIQAYPKGNSEYTVEFLAYLQQQYPDKRLVIIWDGASYHKFGQTPDYLAKLNQDLTEDNWQITCLLFAPHAPEQNPVEAVWLKGKRFIRKHFHLCLSFKAVKKLFVETLHHQTFHFSKLLHYRQFLHFI